jgi:hypothetical protein
MLQLTDQQYYEDENNWGEYQYVLLKEIINNFYIMYVGDDKVINDCKRYEVIFHAKRGLQELNYDAGREVRALELEVAQDLKMPLPKDYINYVRISYVDENGNLRPLIQNNSNSISVAYLQDNNYNVMFDNNGDALEGTPLSETLQGQSPLVNANRTSFELGYPFEAGQGYLYGARFGMDGKKANRNGSFMIEKDKGFIRFSSELQDKTIVIEYISDGLSDLSESELKVNKLAEKYLYHFIKAEILTNKVGIQEYIVRRAKDEFKAIRNNTKIRLMNLRYDELLQSMRSQTNWIK